MVRHLLRVRRAEKNGADDLIRSGKIKSRFRPPTLANGRGGRENAAGSIVCRDGRDQPNVTGDTSDATTPVSPVRFDTETAVSNLPRFDFT